MRTNIPNSYVLAGFSILLLLICLSTEAAFAQKAKTASIRSVDFKNRTYNILGEAIRLRNGKYSSNGARYSLERPSFKDFDLDRSDEAIVTLQKRTTGLVGRYRVYLVYSYKNRNLKLIFGQIRPRGEPLRIEQGNLILSGFYWEKKDDDCCPSKKEIEVYQWNKKRKNFVRLRRQIKKA